MTSFGFDLWENDQIRIMPVIKQNSTSLKLVKDIVRILEHLRRDERRFHYLKQNLSLDTRQHNCHLLCYIIYCHLPPSPTLKKIWWRENFTNTAPVTLPKYKTFCRKRFPKKYFFDVGTRIFFENFSKIFLHRNPFLWFFHIY